MVKSLCCSKVLPRESSPTRNRRKQENVTSVASEPASVELAEADVLGAIVDEPLDVYKIAALRWWLHSVHIHLWKSAFVCKSVKCVLGQCASNVHSFHPSGFEENRD